MLLTNEEKGKKSMESPSTACLNLKSKFYAKTIEERNISKIEILSFYENNVSESFLANSDKSSCTDNSEIGSWNSDDVESPIILNKINYNSDMDIIIKKHSEEIKNTNKQHRKSFFLKKIEKEGLFERRKKFSLTSKIHNQNLIMNNVRMKNKINEDIIYFNFVGNFPLNWEINGINILLKNLDDFKNKNVNILLHNLSSSCLAFKIRNFKKINEGINIFCDSAIPFCYFYSEKIKNGKTK